MFDVKRFIDKLKDVIPIDDITKILEKLPNDPNLNQISSNTGTIGSAINIVLHLTEKIYQSQIPIGKRLSLTLMRIMVESAKDSLPYSVIDIKFNDIFDKNKKSEDFENIILDLFNPRYENSLKKGSLPVDFLSLPVFKKFRNLLSEGIINVNNKYKLNIDITLFLTEFNSNLLLKLEEEKTNNKDLKNLLHKWQVNNDFQNLISFLKNARNLFFEVNKIDEKSLAEYYIENKAYVVDKDTWEYDEELIKSKNDWSITSFLSSNKPIETIAAPFGIGKSSLAKKIAYDCATKFIEDPISQYSYLPIFVPLKFALETTCNDNSLINDLTKITSYCSKREKTNILVILDGLDELPNDRIINIYNIYSTILNYNKDFPNTKFIITTRLESGFPNRLNINDSYIRLFSFTQGQIKDFFHYYDLSQQYDKISNMLSEKKLGKPLFCWMIATVFNRCSDEEKEILFNYSTKDNLGEVFLYQQFIHNVIFGKPKGVVEKEFKDWAEKSIDEKKALRLIAFLKHDKQFISKSKIIDLLDSLHFNLPKDSKSLLSTYFTTSRDEQGKEKFDFIHKSFQEYLLAEFYLESIVNENFHRLIGNEPSKETYYFINGLLKLLNHKDVKVQTYSAQIILSLLPTDLNLSEFIKILRSNAIKLVSQQSLLPEIPRNEIDIWNYHSLEYNDLGKIWTARWLAIYIAGNLINKINREPIDIFLQSAGFFIINNSYLKNKVLSSITLSNSNNDINLTNANLSQADLSHANLSHANLSQADLSHANLSQADLSHANLSHANLSNVLVENTDFTYANLSSANLSTDLRTVVLRSIEKTTRKLILYAALRAYSNSAPKYFINLSNANLEKADFSRTDLSSSDLSNTNLTRTDIIDTDLSGSSLIDAVLYNTNLDNANLTNANLSNTIIVPTSFKNMKVDKKTNFNNSVTTSSEFIEYLEKKAVQSSNLPKFIKEQELKNKLRAKSITYSDLDKTLMLIKDKF